MVARVATPPPVPRITAEPTLTPNKSGKRRPGTFLAGAGDDRTKMPSDEMLKGVVMLVNEEGSVCHVDAESGVIPKRPCGPTVGMCGTTGEWSVITGDGGRIPVARAMSRFEQLQREVVEAAHAQRAAEGGAERTASLESLDRFMSLDDPLDDSLLEPLATISSGDDGGDDPLPHDPKLRPADLEAFSKAAAGARRPASSPPLHALPDVALSWRPLPSLAPATLWPLVPAAQVSLRASLTTCSRTFSTGSTRGRPPTTTPPARPAPPPEAAPPPPRRTAGPAHRASRSTRARATRWRRGWRGRPRPRSVA